MKRPQKFPRVGIGVIVTNKNGEVLVGKRKGSHAPYYSIPGGHLELGETFEETAMREIKEETNLDITNPKVVAIVNGLNTYKNEGLRFVSVVMLVRKYRGKVKLMEPKKCEEWLWADPESLPNPHYEASERGVRCYLQGQFYIAPNK